MSDHIKLVGDAFNRWRMEEHGADEASSCKVSLIFFIFFLLAIMQFLPTQLNPTACFHMTVTLPVDFETFFVYKTICWLNPSRNRFSP